MPGKPTDKQLKRTNYFFGTGFLYAILITFAINAMVSIALALYVNLNETVEAGIDGLVSAIVFYVAFYYLGIRPLARAKSEAEAILSGISDGLVVVDRNGKIIMTNRAFEKLLGWKADEVMEKQMTDIVARYDDLGNAVPFEERILPHVLSGEEVIMPVANYSYFAKKDGTKFPVRIAVAPIIADGTIVGAVEIFHDITAEKILEQKVQDRTKELERENKLMIGRELKMIELKEEIVALRGGPRSNSEQEN
jgi:PAS domain S-box-containing protein